MQAYLDVLRHIRNTGEVRDDRTGTGTVATFGNMARYDLRDGFPLLTTRKLHLRSILHELLWFLKGDTNVQYLRDNGVTIWDEWAHPETGELPHIYGENWVRWPDTRLVPLDTLPDYQTKGFRLQATTNDGRAVVYREVNQIARLIDGIRNAPHGRRHILSGWNPATLEESALPACHTLYQWYVTNDGGLKCLLYCRSQDTGLGTPYNIASAGLLTLMIAQQCNLTADEIIWVGGDTHIYQNHLTQIDTLLTRSPTRRPTVTLRHRPSIFDYVFDDFTLSDYEAADNIPMPVST